MVSRGGGEREWGPPAVRRHTSTSGYLEHVRRVYEPQKQLGELGRHSQKKEGVKQCLGEGEVDNWVHWGNGGTC